MDSTLQQRASPCGSAMTHRTCAIVALVPNQLPARPVDPWQRKFGLFRLIKVTVTGKNEAVACPGSFKTAHVLLTAPELALTCLCAIA